jgi:hypothetical protein
LLLAAQEDSVKIKESQRRTAAKLDEGKESDDDQKGGNNDDDEDDLNGESNKDAENNRETRHDQTTTSSEDDDHENESEPKPTAAQTLRDSGALGGGSGQRRGDRTRFHYPQFRPDFGFRVDPGRLRGYPLAHLEGRSHSLSLSPI